MRRNTRDRKIDGRLRLATGGVSAVLLSLTLGVFPFSPVHARQQGGHMEFDVASIKPSNPNGTGGTVVSATPAGRLHVANATIKDLIETAYDVRDFQIKGEPKWADADKYDIDATPGTAPQSAAASGGNWTVIRSEVQALLKDRFQLQVHRETRTAPIYSLVSAKSLSKSSVLSATQTPQKGINAGQGTMIGEAATMNQLAYKLSRLLQRPVVNNTGLDGNYDFKLEWTPDLALSAPDGQPVNTAAGPSIFTALQEQLGLRLRATKGPVDVMIVDHVDKPSQN